MLAEESTADAHDAHDSSVPPRPRPAAAGTLRVLKFGGTSVGDAARLGRVADLVAAATLEERVVVVLSALSGVTDLLLSACDRAVAGDSSTPLAEYRARHGAVADGLADALGPLFGGEPASALRAALDGLAAELERSLSGIAMLGDASPRVRAQVASLGERASVELLAALLEARGLAPERLDARRLLPCDGDPLEARPRIGEARARLAPFLASGAPLAIVAGYFGGDGEGRAMLLGRGGSDYSAALFAQALGRPVARDLDRRRRHLHRRPAGRCRQPGRCAKPASKRRSSSPTSAPRCSTRRASRRRGPPGSRCASRARWRPTTPALSCAPAGRRSSGSPAA